MQGKSKTFNFSLVCKCKENKSGDLSGLARTDFVLAGGSGHSYCAQQPEAPCLAASCLWLRVAGGEVVTLRPEHIESSRMKIRIEEAKGRKDRYTILSAKALEVLRSYWQAYRPGAWLFPGQDKRRHISVSTAQKVYTLATEKAGVAGGRGIHTLRHCFATHACDQGVEIFVIRKWLGHSRLETTSKYLHMSVEKERSIHNPLDSLFGEVEV